MRSINDNTLSQKLDLLEPHAEHLARMKDQNQSTAEILAWLRTQGIYHVDGGHLDAFWERREATSQGSLNSPSIPHNSPTPPSPAKIAANRLNAQKSTGPKTTAGKAASSQNAFKHTALARAVLVSSRSHQESTEDFQALCSEYHDALNPVGTLELMLVEQIVTAVWRLRRVRKAESGEIALNLDQQAEPKEKEPHPFEQVVDLLESAESGHVEDICTSLADKECGCVYLLGTLKKAYEAVVRDKIMSRETFNTMDTDLQHSASKLTDPLKRMIDERETNPDKLDPESLASKHEVNVLAYLDKQITHYGTILKGMKPSGSTAVNRARQDAALLPAAGVLHKILRYETVLEQQIFRAMDQLEKLQRRRSGGCHASPALEEGHLSVAL